MLNDVAELRARGDLAAISDLVPYAKTIGIELLRDERGLLTALRFREHNIGNFVAGKIGDSVHGARAVMFAVWMATKVSKPAPVIHTRTSRRA